MGLFKRDRFDFTPKQAEEIQQAAREDDAEEAEAARQRLLEQAKRQNRRGDR
jgi:hypothetical protein